MTSPVATFDLSELTPTTSPGRPALVACDGCRDLAKRVARIEERFPDDIDARELEGQVDEHEDRLRKAESLLAELHEVAAGVRQVLSRNHVQEMTLERSNAVMLRATLVLDAINERAVKAALGAASG